MLFLAELIMAYFAILILHQCSAPTMLLAFRPGGVSFRGHPVLFAAEAEDIMLVMMLKEDVSALLILIKECGTKQTNVSTS